MDVGIMYEQVDNDFPRNLRFYFGTDTSNPHMMDIPDPEARKLFVENFVNIIEVRRMPPGSV